MPGTYTVDASVFMNAFLPREEGHAGSRRFLSALQERACPVIVPVLLLAEVAATIVRGRGDARLAREFAMQLRQLPHLVLIPVDIALAELAIDVAAGHRLRGSDAVYAALALRFGSTLVSRDSEQLTRVAGILTTWSPEEALAELGLGESGAGG